jgi:glucokinase
MQQLSVGVDVGGTKAFLVAYEGGQVRSERRIATGEGFTPQRLEQEIASFVANQSTAVGSIGLAVPGIVDAQQRVVACDALPALDGWLFSLPGVKTAVLNDTAAALGAARQDFQPTATAALVTVGTAIGAAFQMNGVIATGAKGWAGELGYMPVRARGGGVQHLDSVAGGAALLARSGLSAPELWAGLAEGDESLRALVVEAGQALGLALATLVNLLNPELIVLGGGTLAYTGYVEAALAQAEAWSFSALWQCCRIVVSPHGERLVALGAATAAALAA